MRVLGKITRPEDEPPAKLMQLPTMDACTYTVYIGRHLKDGRDLLSVMLTRTWEQVKVKVRVKAKDMQLCPRGPSIDRSQGHVFEATRLLDNLRHLHKRL
jgi:hypothetical protein